MSLASIWEKLNGKKTLLGAALLFINGGLVAIGYKIPGLNELGMALVGVGFGHKAIKKK